MPWLIADDVERPGTGLVIRDSDDETVTAPWAPCSWDARDFPEALALVERVREAT